MSDVCPICRHYLACEIADFPEHKCILFDESPLPEETEEA